MRQPCTKFIRAGLPTDLRKRPSYLGLFELEVRFVFCPIAQLDDQSTAGAGAVGYLLKDTPRANLICAIEGTVRNYVSSLFSKLNVSDRTQAAVIALRHGLAD